MQTGSVGFLGFLALIFIALKLAGVGAVATWTWFWVLSPILIPILIALGVGAIWLIIAAIVVTVAAVSARS